MRPCFRTLYITVLSCLTVFPFGWCSTQKDEPVGAAEEPKSSGRPGEKDVLKKLQYIEAWSRRDKSLEPKTLRMMRVSSAIAELQKTPEISVPPVAEAFTDKTRDRTFRVNCAQMLREMGAALPVQYTGKLEGIVRDETEDPVVRIDAAHFLLRDNRQLSPSIKKAILNMADRFLREGKEKPHVRLMVILQLKDDPRAVDIMLDELKRASDFGPTLYALGKMKDRRATSAIGKLLATKFKDSGFPKTRAYIALGEIGGASAFDELMRNLPKETEDEQRRILRAIGLTKDSRAKQVLLDYLQNKPRDYYIAALEGLQYLGDSSILPLLYAELNKPLPEFEKQWLKKTIDAVAAGGKTPDW